MTFGEFRALQASDVVGICSNKETFRSMTNEATERLMNRGGFIGTVRKWRSCLRCNVIVWPRAVLTPLAVNICGMPVISQGYFGQFLPMNGTDYRWAVGYLGSGSLGLGRSWGNAVVQQDAGTTPVQAPIECNRPRYIRAFPAYKADEGKTVTIFGIDSNGQEIFTKRSDGTYQPGVVLTLAVPFVGTPLQVRQVTRVLKDATMGPVRLYAYDAVNNVMEDLAYYQPSERSPAFAQSTIRGARRAVGNSCNGLTPVEALVKLRFIPVETDDDEILLDNWTALKLEMLSIRAENSGDTDEALKLQARAVHELNLQIRQMIPEDQMPISIDVFGSATPRSIGVGLVV